MRLANEAKVPREENRRAGRGFAEEPAACCSGERSPAESGVSDEECPFEFTTAVYLLTTPLANPVPAAHSKLTPSGSCASLSLSGTTET